MNPPQGGERWGPRQSPTTTNTTKTKTLTKEPGHCQCKGPPCCPRSFNEWARLMAEKPFTSSGWTP